MSLQCGDVIDGKYRIVRLIGTGGMGAVYEAEHTRIRRRVAVKILSGPLAASEDAVARFEREAQAAGRIGNDHILEVLDLGALPNGTRYMVMEYLEGETLLSRIQRYVRLSAAQVAPLARQFLSALGAAHAAGIIHRDLKPENIFILREKAGRRDFVKLIDFGVSKFADVGPEMFRVTRAGMVVGTPCYMSPEQARGSQDADVRSDIYAVGVILYEAVTGRVPFDAGSFNDLMFTIALTDPQPPSTFAPDLEPGFEKIILKAMARDPKNRFQSVEELADALEGWLELRGGGRSRGTQILDTTPPPAVPSPPPPVSASETAPTLLELPGKDPLGAPPTQTDPAWGLSGLGMRPAFPRPRRIAVAVAAAAAVLVVVGAIAATRGPSGPSRAEAAKVAPSPALPPPLPTAVVAPDPTTPEPVQTAPAPSQALPGANSRGAIVTARPTARPNTGASSASKTPPKPAPSARQSKPIDFGY
jgi:serine/threonine-protein kinase